MEEDLLQPLREAKRAGVFTDFDGTLSHIVHVPSDARPVNGAKEILSRLQERFAVVSVVSGRSAGQLLEWLGPSIEIWGVHGAETVSDGKVVLSPKAEPYRELMSHVIEEAKRRVCAIGMNGLLVEDKAVMIGLHFRAAEDVERARVLLDEVAEDLAREFGLSRAGGRLAYELRPPARFSKEDVVLERAREADLDAILFAGDDRVDLPAFDALDLLSSQGTATVRVAVASDEGPPELFERADILVQGPDGVVGLFEELLSPRE